MKSVALRCFHILRGSPDADEERHLAQRRRWTEGIAEQSVHYRKRGLPFPMLESLDLPDRSVSCGVRAVSTVPTQALMLMNDEFVVKQAELFAGRMCRKPSSDKPGQVELAYKLAVGRPSGCAASATSRSIVSAQAHDLAGFAHVLLNLNAFAYLR